MHSVSVSNRRRLAFSPLRRPFFSVDLLYPLHLKMLIFGFKILKCDEYGETHMLRSFIYAS